MPIYAFTCKNGHTFEKLVRNPEAEAPVRCPECHGLGKRQFAGFAEHNSTQTKSSTSYKARQRFTRW